MSITVILADDHVPTRVGLRSVLEAAGMEVCADVGSGPAAVSAVHEHRPDLALLDVSMPGGGLAAAAEIDAVAPETAIVMLTVSVDDADLIAAVFAGARGYLPKDTDPDRLPHTLAGVLAGEAAIPRALVSRLLDELRSRDRRRAATPGAREPLTDREREVFALLRRGQSTRAMAAQLGLSEITVRRHVSGVLAKLGAKSRAEAVEIAERAGRMPARTAA